MSERVQGIHISRREFFKGFVAGGLAVSGLTDAIHTVNKRIQIYEEAKAKVKALGTPEPSKEAVQRAQQIKEVRGEDILNRYTLEDIHEAQATLEQRIRFKNQVDEKVHEKVQRGEGPSGTRLLVDFGAIFPSAFMIAKRFNTHEIDAVSETGGKPEETESTSQIINK